MNGLEALMNALGGSTSVQKPRTLCPKVFEYQGKQWVILFQTDEIWFVTDRAQMDRPFFDVKAIPISLLGNEYPEGKICTAGFAFDRECDQLAVQFARREREKKEEWGLSIPDNDGRKYPYPVVNSPEIKKVFANLANSLREDLEEKPF